MPRKVAGVSFNNALKIWGYEMREWWNSLKTGNKAGLFGIALLIFISIVTAAI